MKNSDIFFIACITLVLFLAYYSNFNKIKDIEAELKEARKANLVLLISVAKLQTEEQGDKLIDIIVDLELYKKSEVTEIIREIKETK